MMNDTKYNAAKNDKEIHTKIKTADLKFKFEFKCKK